MSDNKFLGVLQSRKFWMSAIGLILILVTTWGQDPYPTDAVVTAIMGVVAAYIAATAWEDGKQAEAAGTIGAASVTAEQSAPAVGIDATTVNVRDNRPELGRMG